MSIDLHVFTNSYVLSFKIENVLFYVDEDGDLTSNINKAARLDESKAKTLARMYQHEGIDINPVLIETAKTVTI